MDSDNAPKNEVRRNFFSWNPTASFGGDLEFHVTAEEARSSAEGALENALDEVFDEDSECICWGRVLGWAKFEKEHEHGKGTPCWDEAFEAGDHECSAGIALEWDYAITGKLEEVEDSEQKQLKDRVAELERELSALKAQVCFTHKMILENEEPCLKCEELEVKAALDALKDAEIITQYVYLDISFISGRVKVWVYNSERHIEEVSSTMMKLNFAFFSSFTSEGILVSEWGKTLRGKPAN
jgi:hypothetical protein